MSRYLSAVMRRISWKPMLVILILILFCFSIPQNYISIKTITQTRADQENNTNIWYINNETIIDSEETFSNGTIEISSTGSILVASGGSLTLFNMTIIFNTSGNTTPSLQVLAGGYLKVINTKLSKNYYPTPSVVPDFRIIFYPGSEISIDDSYFNLRYIDDAGKPEFTIKTSNIKIKDCTFHNGFTGLSFQNVSNISITGCEFYNCNYSVEINNSNNITFRDCSFIDMKDYACRIINSGRVGPINLINSTISTLSFGIPAFQLISSNLTIINVTHNKIGSIDETSELIISWYFNLRTLDKKDQPLDSVEVTIIDNTSLTVVTKAKTDASGRLNWIILKAKSYRNNELAVDYNPYKIIANKKGKTQYSITNYLDINETNSAQPQVFNLGKKKEKDEDDFQDTLLTFCICFIVIITVFIILLSINIYLVRKKAGLSAYNQYSLENGRSKKQTSPGEGMITCSECGTEVAENAKFCPHCGDFFEGDEFTCPGCSAKLKEDASSCSKCGKVFDSNDKSIKDREVRSPRSTSASPRTVEEKDDKLYCSECGGVVDDSDRSCPGCGSKFYKLKAKSNVDKKSNKQEGTTQALKVTAKEELLLRKDRDAELTDFTDDTFMCSICGEAVKESSKNCPKCGTEFE